MVFNAPRLKDIRNAMCYATFIAAPYERQLASLNLAFYEHTEEAQEARERWQKHLNSAPTARKRPKAIPPKEQFAEALATDLQTIRQPVEQLSPRAAQYVATHPEDWQESSSHYLSVCQAVQQFGKNEVMLALLHRDQDRLAAGRSTMAHSVQAAQRINEPSNEFHFTAQLQRDALASNGPHTKAEKYNGAFHCMKYLVQAGTQHDSDQNRFLASTVLKQEHSARHRDNVNIFSGLDPLKAGGAASLMRDISDAMYKDRLHGPLKDAEEALASGNIQDLEDALRQDHNLNQAMRAIAYRFQQESPHPATRPVPYEKDHTTYRIRAEQALADAAKTALHREQATTGRSKDNHPSPEFLQAALRQAEHYHLDHANVMDRLDRGEATIGNTMYFRNSAKALEYLARAETVQEALNHLASHPNWRQEIAESRRHYQL